MKKILLIIVVIVVVIGLIAIAKNRRNNTPETPILSSVSDQSIEFGGLTRTYKVYVPEGITSNDAVPLVLVLHGGNQNAEKIRGDTGTSMQFENIADQEKFIVVYPNAALEDARLLSGTAVGNWNDGRKGAVDYGHDNNIDDVGFIAALLDELERTYPIDTKRIYVTGASNGGMMTNRLACEMADRIAAFAPVIGSLPTAISPTCNPGRPVPYLMINGTDDPIMQWDSGFVYDFIGRPVWGERLSVPDTLARWKELNKCSDTPQTFQDPNPTDDGVTVSHEVYSCGNGTKTVLYTLKGAGHTWPRGNTSVAERIVGKTTQDFSGGRIIWDFFKEYSL